MESADIIQNMMLARKREEKVKVAAVMPATVETFFTTERAKTYHKQGCFSIRNAELLIELTREEMEASGRKACGNCLGG